MHTEYFRGHFTRNFLSYVKKIYCAFYYNLETKFSFNQKEKKTVFVITLDPKQRVKSVVFFF